MAVASSFYSHCHHPRGGHKLLPDSAVLGLLSLNESTSIVQDMPLYQRVIRFLQLSMTGKRSYLNTLQGSIQKACQRESWPLLFYRVRNSLSSEQKAHFDNKFRIIQVADGALQCNIDGCRFTIKPQGAALLPLWMRPESLDSNTYRLPCASQQAIDEKGTCTWSAQDSDLLQIIMTNSSVQGELVQTIKQHQFMPDTTPAGHLLWFSSAMLATKSPAVLVALIDRLLSCNKVNKEDKSNVLQMVSSGNTFANIDVNDDFINQLLPKAAIAVDQEALACLMRLLAVQGIRQLQVWLSNAKGIQLSAAIMLQEMACICWPVQSASFHVSQHALEEYRAQLSKEDHAIQGFEWAVSQGNFKLARQFANNLPMTASTSTNATPSKLKDLLTKEQDEARVLVYQNLDLEPIGKSYGGLAWVRTVLARDSQR